MEDEANNLRREADRLMGGQTDAEDAATLAQKPADRSVGGEVVKDTGHGEIVKNGSVSHNFGDEGVVKTWWDKPDETVDPLTTESVDGEIVEVAKADQLLGNNEAEELPRYKLKLQDDDTGVVMAVGTDNLKDFMTTDFKKFMRQFRANVAEAERAIGQAKADQREV